MSRERDLFTTQHVELGKLNALVNKIMKETKIHDPNEVIRMVNAGEIKFSAIKPKWVEKDGIIRFPVTSHGLAGEGWVPHLVDQDFCVPDKVKYFLRSPSFKPTSGVTYEVVVLKGELFSDNERITPNIYKEAENRKLTISNAEIACLAREKFLDEELEDMGVYKLIIMHEPFKSSNGDFCLSCAEGDDGESYLDFTDVNYSRRGSNGGRDDSRKSWSYGSGFAFISRF